MRWLLLQRAVDQDLIDLEVINARHEISGAPSRCLAVRQSGWEGDAWDGLAWASSAPQLPAVLGTVSGNSAAADAGLRQETRCWPLMGRPIGTGPTSCTSSASRPASRFIWTCCVTGSRFGHGDAGCVDEQGQEIGRIGVAVS
jgi:hypothetical protein